MAEFQKEIGELYLREATVEDTMLLFVWANDLLVRQNSFSSKNIVWDEHRKWFELALSNDNVKIYVLQYNELPVGQIRIENNGSEWRIGYSIDDSWRGNGYGRQMLCLLESKVVDGTHLLGEVKRENIASQKIFEELGYRKSINAKGSFFEYRKCVKK